MSETLYRFSILFATVTGTGSVVLSLLAWERFRGSPFGRVMFLLPIGMAAFTAFHALLFFYPKAVILPLETIAFTGILVFVGLMLRLHHQMSRRTH